MARRGAHGVAPDTTARGDFARELSEKSVGAVLAGAVVVWVLPGAARGPAPAPAAQFVASATPSSVASTLSSRVPDPPASLDGLTRVAAVMNSMSASGIDLKVKPTSHATTVAVICANPRSWVVTAVKGSRAGQVSRCQGGMARHAYNRRSLPSGWLDGRQSIRVWVFPPTELIGQVSLDGCAVADKQKGTCNGRYAAQELIRYDVALELAADLGARPGMWSAGVYDRI